MGEMGDLVTEYLNQRGEDTGNWSTNYNHQDFINWLCGDDDGHRYQEYKKACAIIDELQSEINLIASKTINDWVSQCIFYSPPSYWTKPSAFHEGHHPKDELGKWGNLIHVKRVVKVATILADIENLSSSNKDILLAACLLHDIGKYGIDGTDEKITKSHPSIVRDMVADYELEMNIKESILQLIETHMGRWHIPKPTTMLQWLCHYADYIASQHDIIIPVFMRIKE